MSIKKDIKEIKASLKLIENSSFRKAALYETQKNLLDDIHIKVDKVTELVGANSWQELLDQSMEEATKLINEGIKDTKVSIGMWAKIKGYKKLYRKIINNKFTWVYIKES